MDVLRCRESSRLGVRRLCAPASADGVERAGPTIKDVHVRASICRKRRGRALLRRTCPNLQLRGGGRWGTQTRSLTVVTQWWLACRRGRPATALHALQVMLLCSLYGMAGAVCEMDVHTQTEFAPLRGVAQHSQCLRLLEQLTHTIFESRISDLHRQP